MCWGLGSTLTSDGRQVFDAFYRKLLYGDDKENPKPKTYKLTKQQLFPERGNVFEYIYDKKNNGTWIPWIETIEKTQNIPANVKVMRLLNSKFFGVEISHELLHHKIFLVAHDLLIYT